MFGFELTQTKFNWIDARPKPPEGYIEYNDKKANCQSGKCPNCGEEKPGTGGGRGGGFQDRQIQNLMNALDRINERLDTDHPHWKPHFDLFSIDLDPDKEKYSTMLKCHPSRYGTGKFLCCGAEIWHDFISEGGKSWKHYYKPTKDKTLKKWF